MGSEMCIRDSLRAARRPRAARRSMTGDELAAWVDSIFPGIELALYDSSAVATSIHRDLPVAITLGFSSVDTGLTMQGDPDTQVACEIVVRGDVDKQVLATTAVEAARMVAGLGVPAQPGVLLEDLFTRADAPDWATVRHGMLREPELFELGTPCLLYTSDAADE